LAKPFVKWAGGKRQLIDQLLTRLPATYGAYHEPMVGGGALFFALRERGLIHDGSLSDINPWLVNLYTVVRDNPTDLVNAIDDLTGNFSNTPDWFYSLRARYRQIQVEGNASDSLEAAALFICLNRTCFNGLYRVNKKGEFNVPFGKYKNPQILDARNLFFASEALQGFEILHDSFHTVVERADQNDLVYFDPPYIPVSESADFTSFAREGFDFGDQQVLAFVFDQLTDKDVSVMLSNAHVPLALKLYKGSYIDVVPARRAINRIASRRGAVNEIIVRNYETTSE